MTNVEKVKAGELHVENNKNSAMLALSKHLVSIEVNAFDYYYFDTSGETPILNGYDDKQEVNYIPATVLLSEIEGKTQLTKEEAVRQIKARELAIENDDINASEKCRKILFPKDDSILKFKSKIKKYWFRHLTELETWVHSADLESFGGSLYITATELLKLLESETAWSPKVGEMYEFGNDSWTELREYFGKGSDEYPYLAKMENGFVSSFKKVRKKNPLEIPRTEAEALLSELKGETYKIVD